MSDRSVLIGQKFGKLTVIAEAPTNKKGDYWACRCDCGNTSIVRGADLRRGHTKSCKHCNTYEIVGDLAVCTMANGKRFITDKDNYDTIKSFVWHDSNRYITAHQGEKVIHLHRLLIDCPIDMFVDHINGNPYDNRRENLRLATTAENGRNSKLKRNNTTGYKGVNHIQKTGRFRAYIAPDRKQIHLGCFDTAMEAARAYNEAASLYFGEFARLNVI